MHCWTALQKIWTILQPHYQCIGLGPTPFTPQSPIYLHLNLRMTMKNSVIPLLINIHLPGISNSSFTKLRLTPSDFLSLRVNNSFSSICLKFTWSFTLVTLPSSVWNCDFSSRISLGPTFPSTSTVNNLMEGFSCLWLIPFQYRPSKPLYIPPLSFAASSTLLPY